MTSTTRALTAAATAILKADDIATRARVAPVDAFALKPVPRAPKKNVAPVAPKAVARVAPVARVASKPVRVKAGVIASTPAVNAAPADTFTTVSIAREYGKSPKMMRAYVRRHIEALKPLMTAQHVYPSAHRAQVLAILKLA